MCQESEDAVKALAKEKDLLEREKWDLRRQSKEAMEQANLLRSHMDTKENRIKELEAELTMVCVCVCVCVWGGYMSTCQSCSCTHISIP